MLIKQATFPLFLFNLKIWNFVQKSNLRKTQILKNEIIAYIALKLGENINSFCIKAITSKNCMHKTSTFLNCKTTMPHYHPQGQFKKFVNVNHRRHTKNLKFSYF